MQRLRLTFSRGEEIKYISHLDIMRLWQRALRRASIPLTYSQGFNPHPRISLAAPLAIGVTSSSELMDIFLERRYSPHFFLKSIRNQLPCGIDISEVVEIGMALPSLQSLTRSAEYSVSIEDSRAIPEIDDAINSILNTINLPWQHMRDKEIRKYDLRALIDALWIIESNPPHYELGMRLRCDSRGTGRPEQVTAALGFTQAPISINRTKLILNKPNRGRYSRQ